MFLINNMKRYKINRLLCFYLLRQLGKIPISIRLFGIKATYYSALRKIGELFDHPLSTPRVIRINPTDYICNNRCPMCSLQTMDQEDLAVRKKRESENRLMLKQYSALFQSLQNGLQEVNIVGGGEPFMHPECLEIMFEIKRRGLKGSIITNGALIKENVSRSMIEMGWDQIRISVNAGDRETYKSVNGVDRFELLRANLKHYNQCRHKAGKIDICHFELYFVIQRANFSSIKSMFEFAEEVGADFICFDMVIPFNPETSLTTQQRSFAYSTIVEISKGKHVPFNRDDILRLLYVPANEVPSGIQEPLTVPLKNNDEPLSDPPKPFAKPFLSDKQCVIAFHQAFVRASGDVLPCCFSDEIMGNITKQSFSEIWQGKMFEVFRKRVMNGKFPSYCHTCAPWCSKEVVRQANRPVVTNAPVTVTMNVKDAETGEQLSNTQISAKRNGRSVFDISDVSKPLALRPGHYSLHILADGYTDSQNIQIEIEPDHLDQSFEFRLNRLEFIESGKKYHGIIHKDSIDFNKQESGMLMEGWHDLEGATPSRYRWTEQMFCIQLPEGTRCLKLFAIAPNHSNENDSASLEINVEGQRPLYMEISNREWKAYSIPLDNAIALPAFCHFKMDKYYCPSENGGGEDQRKLGLAIRKINFIVLSELYFPA
ncbi:MAG: radical SAM protein [Pseudomonadota bacterium]